ncbi:DoxX family protein [Tsukamurella soli]|uniref:DoxX family protein n=1 Tax=Tsukamurella soli TaxID=644556 RepID=A0ABP8J5V7_9ACTN
MIRRIARPLLGSIFVYSGYQNLRSPDQTARAAEPLVDRLNDSLPDSALLPTGSRTWVRANAGVQMGGGLLLATGRFPRVASLALAGSLIPSTFVEHQFWNETDPVARQRQQTDFLKNISLFGGLLIAGFDTEGKPGPVWRTKRAVERASDHVSSGIAAITPTAAEASSDLGERVHEWAGTAHDLAVQAGDRLAAARNVAGEHLTDAAAKTTPAVTDAVSTAAHRASVLAKAANERLGEAGERVPDYADAAADTIRRTAPVVADRVRAARDVIGEKAPDVADRARTLVGIQTDPPTLRERAGARLRR